MITAVAALYVHYSELPDSELAAIQSLLVGSGLAIVPLLRDGVVAQHHWLTQG